MNVFNRFLIVCCCVCFLNNFVIRCEEGFFVFCFKDYGSVVYLLEEIIIVFIIYCFILVIVFVVVFFYYLVLILNIIFNLYWRWYLYWFVEICLLNLWELWFFLKVWMYYCKFLIKWYWLVWVIVDIFCFVLI